MAILLVDTIKPSRVELHRFGEGKTYVRGNTSIEGTLEFPAGTSLAVTLTLTTEEQDELFALIERVAGRVLHEIRSEAS